MQGPTHLLVANPAAQSGRNAERIDCVLQMLAARDITAEFLPTQPNGQTVASVADALRAKPFQGVISMGGDGTLREVAQGLFESGRMSEVPLGMLPAGTANNHGRSFGLEISSEALERNVQIIAEGNETRLDLGRISAESGALPKIFIDSIGFGIGARVISRREIERLRFSEGSFLQTFYRDKRVYTVATLQELWQAAEKHEFGVTIVADGARKTHPQLTELLVKGTRVYAGSWVIDRASKHDDGLFEVVAYTNNRHWVLKGLVDLVGRDALDRGLKAGGVELPKAWRAARLSLHFHKQEGSSWPDIQVDGEWFAGVEQLEIEVLPRVLRLIVPG